MSIENITSDSKPFFKKNLDVCVKIMNIGVVARLERRLEQIAVKLTVCKPVSMNTIPDYIDGKTKDTAFWTDMYHRVDPNEQLFFACDGLVMFEEDD